ncbi:MAG: ribosomal protein S5 domain 2-type protein [Monoraphidium minutum]|nr:MAG: ribosomal protein S5 domain 2-type protein [Monoraphidium minutum]
MEASTSEAAPTRAKGRLAMQLRPLLCERGLLQRADGSAKWVQDGSCVLAAVIGPAAAGPRKENAERAVVEVVFKPRSGLATSEDHEWEEVVRQTVEGVLLAGLHPRTLVTVVLQVLAADGSLLACAANAACAALADAGVPLSSLFACVSAAFTAGGALLLDPDAEEEAAAAAVLCLAYPYHHELGGGGKDGGDATAAADAAAGAAAQQELVVDEGLLMCHASGRFTPEQLAAAMGAARRACGGVAKFSRMSLLAGFADSVVAQR